MTMPEIPEQPSTSVDKVKLLVPLFEAMIEVAKAEAPAPVALAAAMAGPMLSEALSELDKLDPAELDRVLDGAIGFVARFRSDGTPAITINGAAAYYAAAAGELVSGDEVRGPDLPDWGGWLGEIDGGAGAGAFGALGSAGPDGGSVRLESAG